MSLAKTHQHNHTTLTFIELAVKSPKARAEADTIRDRLSRSVPPGGAYGEAYKPYDYHADDRVILARACECGKSALAFEMGSRDEMRKLYASIVRPQSV